MTDLLAAVRQLQELQKKATPGPWASEDSRHIESEHPAWPFVVAKAIGDHENLQADAELIVAAVNLVGPLIEDWERRGAEVENRDEQLRRVDDALAWKYTGMGRVGSAERLKRIEEAARRVVEAAIEHEDDPTTETAQTLKAMTKHLDVALALPTLKPGPWR